MTDHDKRSQVTTTNKQERTHTMKGNKAVIDSLNKNLVAEYTAVHQYDAHESLARNAGYNKFADYVKARADAEREHIKELHERIRLLEGVPAVDRLDKVTVADNLPNSLEADETSELTAVNGYRELAKIAMEAGDFVTMALAQHIGAEEEAHLNAIEANMTQHSQMGEDNWLSLQVG